MRVMVLVKATKTSEAGTLPDVAMLEAMGAFNDKLVKAGVLLDGNGLHPTSRGARIAFGASGDRREVIDGPFAETKELLAGYWMLQVKSLEEAIEWMKQCPSPSPGEPCAIELRPVFEPEEFTNAPPELIEKERALRDAQRAR